jgi:glycerophosphoryl diester phosphodiesterase
MDSAETTAEASRALAALASGPPWILGQRGSPLEAPENTVIGLRRALDLGLDGVAYDVRASLGGELVLHADPTLERTTDGHGPIGERTLAELSALDAGGWFDARARGERLALFEEALALEGDLERGAPQHLVIVHERGHATLVARLVRELGRKLSVRIASRSKDVCLEARDAGLEAIYCVDRPGEREREMARDARFAGLAPGPSGFHAEADDLERRRDRGEPQAAIEASRTPVWPCERWAIGVDSPADLLAACRAPLNGFTTHEPLRALSIRALARLAAHGDSPYPIQVPDLEVHPGLVTSGRGDWCGAWTESARVTNPFAFDVRVACGIVPRRGAFDVVGVPVAFALTPGASIDVPFQLTGGSWRTGGDPLFFARFHWRRGPGRAAGALLLDAPLARVRTLRADALAQRLVLLRESPRDPQASMTLRRHRRWLFASIENGGGLIDPRAVLHLDGREYIGGRGVRAPLPDDFDRRPEGLAFSCGFVALQNGERVVRRWAGGVPDELDSGAPGRILPLKRG